MTKLQVTAAFVFSDFWWSFLGVPARRFGGCLSGGAATLTSPGFRSVFAITGPPNFSCGAVDRRQSLPADGCCHCESRLPWDGQIRHPDTVRKWVVLGLSGGRSAFAQTG